MNKKYYAPDWTEGCDWAREYSMLKGPNGFECCLTEPEDRSWWRDGREVVDELNRLNDKNDKLKVELEIAKKFHEVAVKERDYERYRIEQIRKTYAASLEILQDIAEIHDIDEYGHHSSECIACKAEKILKEGRE